MKFGVRDGVLRQSWEGVFGDAAWLGFDGVELDIPADYRSSLLFSEPGRLRLRQLQAGSGVELAAFCIGALWSISPADARADVRDEAVELIGETARLSREVDCSVILVPLTPGEGSSPEDQLKLWIDALRRSAPAAERYGVCLAIENVGRGCGQSAKALRTIIDEIHSPGVQAYYDFGNGLALGQDPVEEIELLGSRIRQLHAKDPGGNRIGKGRVPLQDVARAVRGISYQGYIVLETDPTDAPPTAASDNLHALQELFPEEP